MSSEPVSDGADRRLHPLSFLFTLLGQLRQFALPLLVILFTGRRDTVDWSDLAGLIGVGVLAFVSIAQYFTYRYRIEADGVVIRSGTFQRSLRHIPFGRIQNVSVHQNLLHRLFDVAEVRLESAGAAKPEGQMRVLRLADAHALEQQIRRRVRSAAVDARAANASSHGGSTTPSIDDGGTDRGEAPAHMHAPEDTVLLTLSTGELVRHGLISNRGMLVVGAGFAALAQTGGNTIGKLMEAIGHWLTGQASALHLSMIAATMAGVVLLAVVLVLLRLLSVVLSLLQFHGFVLSESDGRLGVVRGLTTRVRASLPRHRIQAWQVQEGVLHRLFGRRGLRVDTAVTEAANESRSLRDLVPIATPERLDQIVDHLLPMRAWPIADWHAVHPRAWLRKLIPALVVLLVLSPVLAWFQGAWALGGLLVLAALFAWRAQHWARHAGWSVANGLVAFRQGWLSREWRFAESAKLQSIEIAQSPLDRRFGMATLRFDTAGATAFESMFAIPYLPEDTARALYAALSGVLVDTRPVAPIIRSRTRASAAPAG